MEPYFWAKTRDGRPSCSVWEHAQATAEVAKVLLSSLPSFVRELLPDEGAISLVAAHDVGKISPEFQTKCSAWAGPYGCNSSSELSSWGGQKKNHAWISEEILRRLHLTKRCWAECVGAHHGIHEEFDMSNKHLEEEWLGYAKTFLDRLQERYGALPSKNRISEVAQSIMTGFMVLSDWIASNETCFPFEEGIDHDFASTAKKAVEAIGVLSTAPYKKGLDWGQLFPNCSKPHPIQQYTWTLAPRSGVYLIEDSMGGGKTEAALALAYHLIENEQARGIYFALPTQTTSNRIFYRLRDFLENMGWNQMSKTYSWRIAILGCCDPSCIKILHHWTIEEWLALQSGSFVIGFPHPVEPYYQNMVLVV